MDRPRSLCGRLIAKLPASRPSPGYAIVAAVVAAIAATGVAYLLDPVPRGAPFITYYPAILVASVAGGPMAGVLTLAMAIALAGYLWLPFVEGRIVQFTMLSTFALSAMVMIGAVWVMHLALAAKEAAEHHAQLVAGEMAHRLGNLVQLVQSLANATFRTNVPSEEQTAVFAARLGALGAALSAHGKTNPGPAELGEVLHRTLRPYPESQISFDGGDFRVPMHISHRVALIVHELATNALKYGALSRPTGRVAVRWDLLSDGGAQIFWQENGGPPAYKPSRTGYGMRLISSSLPAEMGLVALDWQEAGLCCVITLKPLQGRVGPNGTT